VSGAVRLMIRAAAATTNTTTAMMIAAICPEMIGAPQVTHCKSRVLLGLVIGCGIIYLFIFGLLLACAVFGRIFFGTSLRTLV
jgi:hypothetical protein